MTLSGWEQKIVIALAGFLCGFALHRAWLWRHWRVAREKETEERSPEGIPCGYCRKGWMTEEPVNEEEVRREAASIRMFGGSPLLSPGDRLFVCSERCGYVRVMRKGKE